MQIIRDTGKLVIVATMQLKMQPQYEHLQLNKVAMALGRLQSKWLDSMSQAWPNTRSSHVLAIIAGQRGAAGLGQLLPRIHTSDKSELN